MHSLSDGYALANGVQIPCVGFGTWQTPEGEVAAESVREAIAAGYRHIDTAAAYGNEAGVGEGVRRSGIARGEVFITSKLANPDHGYENTRAAFEKTMANLQMDYLDLYLIHWPNPIKFRNSWQEANAGSWKAMEELYRAGRIRAIGISNFCERHIDVLMETAQIAPMVNQIRLCPGDTQDELALFCREREILLEAYSPLGIGSVFESAPLMELAKKYDRSIAQVCIRWSLQMGFLPLPKSVTPSRIRENGQVFDFTLSPEDVAFIANLKDNWDTHRNPDTINF